MADKNYYEILGVPEGASKEIIEKARKQLKAALHPDRYQDEKSKAAAIEKIAEVEKAYYNLIDPRMRTTRRSDPLLPRPVAKPTNLDFGTLYESDVHSLKFTVRNEGGKLTNEPIMAVSNQETWFTWRTLTQASEGWCPFDIEITAHGALLRSLNRPNEWVKEWVEIDFDGLKTRVTLRARVPGLGTPSESVRKYTRLTPGPVTEPKIDKEDFLDQSALWTHRPRGPRPTPTKPPRPLREIWSNIVTVVVILGVLGVAALIVSFFVALNRESDARRPPSVQPPNTTSVIRAEKISKGRTADEKLHEFVVPANEWVRTSLSITSNQEVLIHHFASNEAGTVSLDGTTFPPLQKPGTLIPLYTSPNCSTDSGVRAKVQYFCVQLNQPEGIKLFARNSVRVGILVKNR